MSRFVTKSIERLDLGEGDWVDLVTRLSYGDRAAIEEKLIARAVMAGDQRPTDGHDPKPAEELEIALAASNRELLKRAITAWGGPGFTLDNGQVAPITEEAIDSLDETGDKILAELRRRLVKPKPGFTQPPSPPTPTAGAEASTEGA